MHDRFQKETEQLFNEIIENNSWNKEVSNAHWNQLSEITLSLDRIWKYKTLILAGIVNLFFTEFSRYDRLINADIFTLQNVIVGFYHLMMMQDSIPFKIIHIS